MNLAGSMAIIQFGHMGTHRIEKSRIVKRRLLLESKDTYVSTLFQDTVQESIALFLQYLCPAAVTPL